MSTSLVIGLTGGIGSGKTLASDHFATLGVDIIDTDVIARTIVEPGQPALIKLSEKFGNHIINKSGTLDRDALRSIAFSNKENKAALDAITHPEIRQQTLRELDASTSPYCIIVVPLLSAGSPFLKLMDRVIVVTAERATKVERVKIRSKLNDDEVERIMSTQLTDEQRLEFADDVIANNSSKEAVYKKVELLHRQYLSLLNA